MPAPSQLTQTILQLYRYTDADEQRVAEELFATRREAWRDQIQTEIKSLGSSRQARSPSSGDLQYLRRISQEDAASIRNTWNQWVTRRVDELYDQNPRGNRNFYFSNLERLAKERDAHHQNVISVNTEKTAREHARQRFIEENGMQDATFVYSGPSPVSDECKERTAADEVTYEYTRRNATPAHVGCPHEWVRTRLGADGAPDDADLWVG